MDGQPDTTMEVLPARVNDELRLVVRIGRPWNTLRALKRILEKSPKASEQLRPDV
jgi:hypothetical protein